ncbi:MAG: transglycosylase SLT domain-containing protein [Candidatus Margulisiibacteriota bacterium]
MRFLVVVGLVFLASSLWAQSPTWEQFSGSGRIDERVVSRNETVPMQPRKITSEEDAFVLVQTIKNQAQSGNWKGASQTYARLKQLNPDGYILLEADLAMAQVARTKGKPVAPYLKSLVLSRHPVLYPEALVVMLEEDLAQNNKSAFETHYGQLLGTRYNPDKAKVLLKRFNKQFRVQNHIKTTLKTSDDWRAYLHQLDENEDNQTLIDAAQYRLDKEKKSPNKADFNLLLGKAYMREFRYLDAIRALKNVLFYRPSAEQASQAVVLRGESHVALGQYGAAEALFKEVIAGAGPSRFKQQAFYDLCSMYQTLGKKTAYQTTLKAFMETFPNADALRLLLWEAQWEEPQNQKEGVPNSIMTAIQGRQGLKNRPETLEGFPLRYSTHMVLQTLGRGSGVDTRLWAHYSRYVELGWTDMAVRDLTQQLQRQPGSKPAVYALATLYARQGNVSKSVVFLQRQLGDALTYGQVDPGFLTLLYPRPYWEWVTAYSTRFGVDPYLVLAIMRRESRFNPDAESFAKAQGLMQLMPATAAHVANRLGMSRFSTAQLRDPKLNLYLGIAYLALLEKSLPYPLHVRLAAYNAGPTVTQSWVTAETQRNVTRFIRKITYPETRYYVEAVLNDYLIYKELYKD